MGQCANPVARTTPAGPERLPGKDGGACGELARFTGQHRRPAVRLPRHDTRSVRCR